MLIGKKINSKYYLGSAIMLKKDMELQFHLLLFHVQNITGLTFGDFWKRDSKKPD